MEGEKASTALQELEREAAFDAIIPSPVRYNDKLRPNAKLLYGEIRALCTTRGYCWASNDYFAKRYKMNERSIARFIAQLEEQKYIRVVILRDESGRVCGRRIYIVFPLEVDENDTLSHMTKKSATCPKSQGEGDQKVSQSLNNNINNIYIGDCVDSSTKRKKSGLLDDTGAREELTAWARSITDDPDELVARLMDFCDMRLTRKKGPVPMGPGRKVTRLRNRLIQYSTDEAGNLSIPMMLEVLDVSIFHEWIDVFPLKADARRELFGKDPAGSGEEDTPWV